MSQNLTQTAALAAGFRTLSQRSQEFRETPKFRRNKVREPVESAVLCIAFRDFAQLNIAKWRV